MGGKNSKHAPSNAVPQADLYRGPGYTKKGYRKNGYDHIKGGGRKARYKKTKKIQSGLNMPLEQGMFKTAPDAGKATHAQRYYFEYGRNFMYSKPPYSNQAHHLLPQEFWQGLTAAQRRILRKLKYSINDGTNIVFLPQDNKGQTIHQLPKHNGSHPKYSAQVNFDTTDVKKRLQKVADQKKDCEEVETPQEIVKKLQKLQKDYWKIVTTSSAEFINNVVFVVDESAV